MPLRLADLRYAARLLSRAPGFTVAAVTTLGIGVNPAIFSIVNEMLFRPLPVRAPEQIVTLSTVDDHVQFPHGMSYVDFLDHRAQLDVFDDLLAYTFAAVKLSTDDGGEGGKFKRGGFRRPKVCRFCVDKTDYIDYKDVRVMMMAIPERGKIQPRRLSGACAKHQRKLTTAVKRARQLALIPYVTD